MGKTTLGTEMRKKRESIKPKLTQDKVATSVGLSLQTVNKHENDREKISEENFRKYLDLYDLSYHDMIFWYGLAGKLPNIKMRTINQIIQVFNQLCPILQKYPYPAYIIDNFSYRYCLVNNALTYITRSKEMLIELAKYNVFELLFFERLGISQLFKNLDNIRLNQIHRYKAINIYSRHQEFYMKYPEKMKPLLLTNEYEQFEKLWNYVHSYEVDMLSNKFSTNIELDILIQNSTIPIKFEVIPQFIPQLGNMFTISWYRPVPEQEAFAKNAFRGSTNGDVIKLWEIKELNLHDDVFQFYL